MDARAEIRSALAQVGRVTFHRDGTFSVERRTLSPEARGIRSEIASLIPDVRVLRVVEFPGTWREMRVSRAICAGLVGGPRVARITSSKGAA